MLIPSPLRGARLLDAASTADCMNLYCNYWPHRVWIAGSRHIRYYMAGSGVVASVSRWYWKSYQKSGTETRLSKSNLACFSVSSRDRHYICIQELGIERNT